MAYTIKSIIFMYFRLTKNKSLIMHDDTHLGFYYNKIMSFSYSSINQQTNFTKLG